MKIAFILGLSCLAIFSSFAHDEIFNCPDNFKSTDELAEISKRTQELKLENSALLFDEQDLKASFEKALFEEKLHDAKLKIANKDLTEVEELQLREMIFNETKLQVSILYQSNLIWRSLVVVLKREKNVVNQKHFNAFKIYFFNHMKSKEQMEFLDEVFNEIKSSIDFAVKKKNIMNDISLWQVFAEKWGVQLEQIPELIIEWQNELSKNGIAIKMAIINGLNSQNFADVKMIQESLVHSLSEMESFIDNLTRPKNEFVVKTKIKGSTKDSISEQSLLELATNQSHFSQFNSLKKQLERLNLIIKVIDKPFRGFGWTIKIFTLPTLGIGTYLVELGRSKLNINLSSFLENLYSSYKDLNLEEINLVYNVLTSVETFLDPKKDRSHQFMQWGIDDQSHSISEHKEWSEEFFNYFYKVKEDCEMHLNNLKEIKDYIQEIKRHREVKLLLENNMPTKGQSLSLEENMYWLKGLEQEKLLVLSPLHMAINNYIKDSGASFAYADYLLLIQKIDEEIKLQQEHLLTKLKQLRLNFYLKY